MFEVRSEAHGRVLSAVEDIKSCCEIGDYYEEWSDIAASSIQAFLEDLSAEQLDNTAERSESTLPKLPRKTPSLRMLLRTVCGYALMKCSTISVIFPKMMTRTRIIIPIMTGKQLLLFMK